MSHNVEVHDLAWLACAIDAEGSVYTYPHRTTAGRVSIMVRVEVCNTDPRFTDKALEIAKALCPEGYQPSLSSQMTVTGKPLWRMNVQSYVSCECVLTAVLPYLIVKKDKAETMLAWVRHRLQGGHKRRGGIKSVYTEEDHRVAESLFGVKLDNLPIRRVGYNRNPNPPVITPTPI